MSETQPQTEETKSTQLPNPPLHRKRYSGIPSLTDTLTSTPPTIVPSPTTTAQDPVQSSAAAVAATTSSTAEQETASATPTVPAETPLDTEKLIELAVETIDFQREHYTKFLRYAKRFSDAMTSAGAELSKLSNAFKEYSECLTNTDDPLISLVSI